MKQNTTRFDRLVAKYYPAVFRLATRLSNSPETAAALARATFERAARNVRRFRTNDSVQFLLLAALWAELSTGRSL